ncbi:SEC-C domain-containing protein [Brevibacillus humidisoli]|uniref:SEC-C domain-containing protein n=1 Tax=Brevibacillus humidisoli TaxID=2895522 RepID=UPI001E29B9E2|nr:SEC-C domain-containing protein [Brevibacillus humidisoli]UFJ41644.1 SEC-C domain-containing protein [Brevibacillus humidisoli]
MSVGRNELCPCGSGKKYKKCCGIVTSISQVRERKLRSAYDEVNERLNTYVSKSFSREEIEQARQRFARETGLTAEEVQHPQWAIHFYNWFVFDDQTDGTTVVESFFESDGRRVEHDVQQAYLQLTLGLYEIVHRVDDVLTVRSLSGGDLLQVVAANVIKTRPGQLLLGRLLPFGQRYQLFTGSIVLPAALKRQFAQWLAKVGERDLRRHTTRLYRFLLKQGNTAKAGSNPPEKLIRSVWHPSNLPAVREALRTHSAFELKKRDESQEIWVYAARKEGGLLAALDNALVELHEVQGELLVGDETIAFEGFPDALSSLTENLPLPEAENEQPIDRLTSSGSRLTRGTIFITSQPPLPSKVMQWAVQTYFAEKWLVTPHPEIEDLPPLLVAAAEDDRLKAKLEKVVDQIEQAREKGAGPGRFMRLDLIRPRLSLPNRQLSIENLLKRPLIDGLPADSFTVHPDRLADIAAFVREMTEGKSESTVKKYDEAMNLFRSFLRSAFGRGFAWEELRREEVAYFLVHDVLRRTDTSTKTLAGNLLSVLSAFFKWLDKQHEIDLSGQLQPLLSALKEELPEAYRLRGQLQKQAVTRLHDHDQQPERVTEEALLVLSAEDAGWQVKRGNGEEIRLQMDQQEEQLPSGDWIVFALIGQTADGRWHLYGLPELYPPLVAELLGVRRNVLV